MHVEYVSGPNSHWFPDAKIGLSARRVKAGTMVELEWEGARGFIQMVEADGSTAFIRVGYGDGNQLIKFYGVGTYTFHLMGDTKRGALMASVALKVTLNTYLNPQAINHDEINDPAKPWRRRKRTMGRPRTSPFPIRYIGWRPTPPTRTHRPVAPKG